MTDVLNAVMSFFTYCSDWAFNIMSNTLFKYYPLLVIVSVMIVLPLSLKVIDFLRGD